MATRKESTITTGLQRHAKETRLYSADAAAGLRRQPDRGPAFQGERGPTFQPDRGPAFQGDSRRASECQGQWKRQGHQAGLRSPLANSLEELKLKTAAHQAGWHFGEADRWSVDQDEGKLVFSFTNETTATAPVQIIGTFNSQDKTWLWGWANPSVNDSLKADDLKVKAYGEQHQISQLTARKWSGSEDDAWAMAALAVKLCGSQGAYRGPAGDTRVFMTFGTVQLQKTK